jgi:adenosylcobinamide-GDP ribazoletransferase
MLCGFGLPGGDAAATHGKGIPMRQTDTALVTGGDLMAAFGLLTRLPVKVQMEQAVARGARAAWAWPLAGAAVALLAGCAGWLAAGFGAAIAAGVMLAVMIMLTGALHEDGLADFADGIWGGQTPDRRLEIMKDSRIGSYGVIALVFGLGLKWQALGELNSVAALIAAALLSRAAMAGVMATLPFARPDGLAASQGRPSRETILLGAGIALCLALVLVGPAALVAGLAAGVAAAVVGAVTHRKIGGQTGDVLGAAQFMAELAALLALLL